MVELNDRRLTSREELAVAAVELVSDAERTVDIVSVRLDAAVFARPSLVDEIRRVAVSHPRAQVRVLVCLPGQVLIDGSHRLVELARRIPSRIAIRVMPDEVTEWREEWLLADERASWIRPDAEAGEGVIRGDDPGLVRRHLSRFDRWWEAAQPSMELRRLAS